MNEFDLGQFWLKKMFFNDILIFILTVKIIHKLSFIIKCDEAKIYLLNNLN